MTNVMDEIFSGTTFTIRDGVSKKTTEAATSLYHAKYDLNLVKTKFVVP